MTYPLQSAANARRWDYLGTRAIRELAESLGLRTRLHYMGVPGKIRTRRSEHHNGVH
jgi:hypothetical protein